MKAKKKIIENPFFFVFFQLMHSRFFPSFSFSFYTCSFRFIPIEYIYIMVVGGNKSQQQKKKKIKMAALFALLKKKDQPQIENLCKQS